MERDVELEYERRIEAAALARHQRLWARHAGVCWSGLDPEPFVPRTPERLAADADARRAASRAWRASARGACLSALGEALRLAQEAASWAESSASALNRGDPQAVASAGPSLATARRTASDLLRSLRRAGRALDRLQALPSPAEEA